MLGDDSQLPDKKIEVCFSQIEMQYIMDPGLVLMGGGGGG